MLTRPDTNGEPLALTPAPQPAPLAEILVCEAAEGWRADCRRCAVPVADGQSGNAVATKAFAHIDERHGGQQVTLLVESIPAQLRPLVADAADYGWQARIMYGRTDGGAGPNRLYTVHAVCERTTVGQAAITAVYADGPDGELVRGMSVVVSEVPSAAPSAPSPEDMAAFMRTHPHLGD